MSNPFNANTIIMDAAKKINTPLFLYTWINSYKYIYDDINTIKIIIYLALSLLIVISCFNITSISLMTISKKTKEIAILRSMGANHLLIQLIFLYYGLRFIIIGSLIGIFLGVITVLNFESITFFLENKINNNFLSENFYYSNFLLLQLNILDVIVIFISTIIIGVITNWYPAYYALKISPHKILKEC